MVTLLRSRHRVKVLAVYVYFCYLWYVLNFWTRHSCTPIVLCHSTYQLANRGCCILILWPSHNAAIPKKLFILLLRHPIRIVHIWHTVLSALSFFHWLRTYRSFLIWGSSGFICQKCDFTYSKVAFRKRAFLLSGRRTKKRVISTHLIWNTSFKDVVCCVFLCWCWSPKNRNSYCHWCWICRF